MVKYIDAPFGRYLYVTPPPAYSVHLGSTKKDLKKDVTRPNKYVHSATVRRYGGPGKSKQQRRPATEGGKEARPDWSRVDSLIEAVYKPPNMPVSYEVRQLAHAGQYRKEQHELPSFRATYFNSAPTHNGPNDLKQTIENFKRAQAQGWRPGTSIQKAVARVAGKPTAKSAEAEDVRLGLGPSTGAARGWAEARTEAVIKAAQRAASRSSRGGRESSRATSRAKSRAHTLPVIMEEQPDRRRQEGQLEKGKSTPYVDRMSLSELEKWKQERAQDAYINEMEKFRKQRHRRFFKDLEEVEHEQIDVYHRQLRETKKKYFETVDQQRAQLKDLRDRYLREQIDRFKRFHLRNEDVQQYLETRSIPRDEYGLPEGLDGELPRVFSPKAPPPPKPPSVKSVMRSKNLSNFASIWNQRAAQPNWAPQTVDDEKLLPDIKKFLPTTQEPPRTTSRGERNHMQKPMSRQSLAQKPQSRASQKAASPDKGANKGVATGTQKVKSPKKVIRLATRGSRKLGTRGTKRSLKVASRQASRGQQETKHQHDSRMPLIVQKVENRVSPNSPER